MRIRVGLLVVTVLFAAPAGARRVPAVGTPVIFAAGVTGPEGIAFEPGGGLIVGTATGQVLRFKPNASRTVLAELGEPLAGITVLRDGRVVAASFGAGRVWVVDPGEAQPRVLASGVPGANSIIETRRHQILVSASSAGTIVDVTSGTPVERASGLSFPNGLALGPGHFLYVAQTSTGDVVRLPLARDGTLGAAQPYATGLLGADGIAFDTAGDLLAVGADTLYVVPPGGGAATVLSTDALLEWPSSLAFGRGRFGRGLYLVNFGLPLGSGTMILRLPYRRVRQP